MLLEKEKTSVNGEDEVRQYLKDIGQFPRLTPEQERELAKGCAARDAGAIRAMVNSNLRLVVSVAREYAGRGVPLMDLIQEGSMGLMAAARKFDYTLEYRFSTYATKWIRKYVIKYIMDNGGLIRIPAHTAEQIRHVLAARSALEQEGVEPTEEALAQRCGITREKVVQLLSHQPEISSLDVPLQENEEGSLKNIIEDPDAVQPFEAMVRQEIKLVLDRLMAMLSERQQQVLRLHYGMENDKCLSLEEIAGILGISKERVRQIERQAMNKMQKLGAEVGLEEYL